MARTFPIHPFEKIAKHAGVERVAESASQELRETFMEMAGKLAMQAVAASHHAKRVTIKKDDVSLAVRIVFK